jgi:glycosyltransferase involved in cell wall biosynthesis
LRDSSIDRIIQNIINTLPVKEFPKMGQIKKILFVSQLCSPHLIEDIFRTSDINLGKAGPKFHRLLAEGLAMNKDFCTVETLSVIPVTTTSHKKRFWMIPPEVFENINYHYVPMINLPVLRNIIIVIFTFFKIVLWSLPRSGKNKVIICDALGLTNSFASILASKLTGTKIITIITDLPGFVILNSKNKNGIKHKVYTIALSHILFAFDGYILLTEYMNEIVNTLNKPYLVMEGLVDIKMSTSINSMENKASKRILLYAGGIFEEYGIKKLIEAFIQLEGADLQLHIYGKGEMEKDMPYYMSLDNRIFYKGIVPNQTVVQRELEATLLINPRPSNKAFTKYSFPSKNMEYMVSGTPLVTTLLPGMPLEYQEYVYLLKDESVEGMSNALTKILEKSQEQLHNFGGVAKDFVLRNKSNLIQTKRILDFF